MATPAITASTSGRSTGAVSSFTLSHTSDTNPLVVLVAYFTTIRSGRSVTYGGTGMVLARDASTGQLARYSGGDWTVEVWLMDAPSSGAANVVVTPVNNASPPVSATAFIAVVAFNASNWTPGTISLPPDAFVSGSGTGPSTSVTSRTGDLALAMVLSDSVNQTFTDGGSQTRILTNTDATNNNHLAFSSKAGASSVTMSFTLGTSDNYGLFLLSLADSSAPAPARMSQEVAESVALPSSSAARMSQEVAETVTKPTTAIRMSQVVVEVVTRHKFPSPTLFT